MTQTMTQTSSLPTLAPSKLLRELVDLVGIEPTTSSMPWKRAPSCATGPHFSEGTNSLSSLSGVTAIKPILPHLLAIVNLDATYFEKP